MRTVPKALGVLAVAVLLVACSGEETLEPGSVEESISSQLEADDGQARTVECPEEISAEVDSTFTCTVTDSADVTADVEATIIDDAGNFEFEVVQ